MARIGGPHGVGMARRGGLHRFGAGLHVFGMARRGGLHVFGMAPVGARGLALGGGGAFGAGAHHGAYPPGNDSGLNEADDNVRGGDPQAGMARGKRCGLVIEFGHSARLPRSPTTGARRRRRFAPPALRHACDNRRPGPTFRNSPS